MSDTSPDAVDWERQRAFLAVLREGSLSGAARALGAAQPTVRRRIEELERQLGVALFTRSPQGLLPTQAAFRLEEPARIMATAADAFLRAASAPADEARGLVRITASEVMSVEVLPSMLTALRERHSGLAVAVGVSNANEDLLHGQADVAVRMVEPTQQALVAQRIGEVPLGLHAHQRYLDAHGTPESLGDLKRYALIGFERETAGVRTLRTRGLKLQPADFAMRTDSDLCQLAAIRAGLGLGVCQVPLARRDPELVHVLPEALTFGLGVWVVTHEDLRRVRRVRFAFDALVQGLTDYLAIN
jgi:DNA-binding transcriptional LysR family regulator